MSDCITFDPKQLDLRRLHGYLLGSVAPRPIALASTIDLQAQVNLSPFSYFNVFSANPPILIFSPARRGTNNTIKHTYENVQEVPEVVVNVVTYAMVEQVSLASSEYPKNINEFAKAGLTQVKSQRVKPPRVAESPVAFECKVNQVTPLGQQGGAGNLIIAEVMLMHIQSKYLDENQVLQTEQLDLAGRMGGDWYIRASGDALFQVSKPGRSLGMGIDQLPDSIKNSGILTGSNLARLAGCAHLPDTDSINQWRSDPRISAILKQSDSKTELHLLAQQMIQDQDLESAFKTLMIADDLRS